MNILSILWEWRFVIIVAVAFLLFCLLEWNKAKSILYGIMLQAKRLAKDAVLNSGQEQEEWVVKKAYQFLPAVFKLFLSEELMQKLIHWLYHAAKDYLDDGKLNDSI